MSCFILNHEPLCKLATWIESLSRLDYSYHGFSAPDSVIDFVTECRKAAEQKHERTGDVIYRRLYNLNARAYAGRYKAVETPLDPFLPFHDICAYAPPEYHSIMVCGREEWHYKPMPWHYAMCKRLDCLIYQCAEDATKADPLLSSLRDLSARLKDFIVTNTADWITADWGRE